jgi:hypothetical protein
MKSLDVTVQSIAFAASLIFLGSAYVTLDWLLAFLCVQFFLGVWQVVSSIGSLVVGSPLRKWKRWHLVLAAFYLIMLYACANSTLPVFDESGIAIKLLFVIPAWALAIFYYILTWKTFLAKDQKLGKFLPHTGF